ncbi:MAG: hypothetical protein LBP85_08570 [Prevotellaceae bacterium]|jgi:hypothetical protein|nr:hypothetical protein [Prevotellaceae bacterium]
MKKFLIILVAFIGFGISTYADVALRGTHKVCANDGTELTLRNSGGSSTFVFWFDGNKYTGKYSLNDGYLNLYENGALIGLYKYSYNSKTQTLNWVDITVN